LSVIVTPEPGANGHVGVVVVEPPTLMETLAEQLVAGRVGGGYPGSVAPAGSVGEIARNAEAASRATADANPTRNCPFMIRRTESPITA
jgi:hypothetical protein